MEILTCLPKVVSVLVGEDVQGHANAAPSKTKHMLPSNATHPKRGPLYMYWNKCFGFPSPWNFTGRALHKSRKHAPVDDPIPGNGHFLTSIQNQAEHLPVLLVLCTKTWWSHFLVGSTSYCLPSNVSGKLWTTESKCLYHKNFEYYDQSLRQRHDIIKK